MSNIETHLLSSILMIGGSVVGSTWSIWRSRGRWGEWSLTSKPPTSSPSRGKRSYPLSCTQQNMLSVVYVAKRLNILNQYIWRGYVQHQRAYPIININDRVWYYSIQIIRWGGISVISSPTINIDDWSSLIPLNLFGVEESCLLNHPQSSILMKRGSLIPPNPLGGEESCYYSLFMMIRFFYVMESYYLRLWSH